MTDSRYTSDLAWAARIPKASMGILTCVVVALSEDARNVVAGALQSLGVETTLLASLEELPTTLEKTPACGVLLEVTSMKASPQGKKAMQEMAEFYPFGRFKLVGTDVLILGKDSLEALFKITSGSIRERPKRFKKPNVPRSSSL